MEYSKRKCPLCGSEDYDWCEEYEECFNCGHFEVKIIHSVDINKLKQIKKEDWDKIKENFRAK